MTERVVVYVTSEVTLHTDLRFYSGGLGEVAGGYARSAHTLGLPVVGLSLLYREGYGDQHVDRQGMYVTYPRRSYDHILKYTGKRCGFSIDGAMVYADIWECPRGTFGSIPFYFLDTDIQANNHLGRINTRQLYGGSEMTGRTMDRMICQAIVLGAGAVEAMRELGYDVAVYHLNESHAVFTPLYLLHRALLQGVSIEDALAAVREKIVFTNHTPIDAGNPKYDLKRLLSLCGYGLVMNEALMHRLGGGAWFDSTLACLRLSRAVTAVSQRHLDICKERWGAVAESAPWSVVTNGVTKSFWQDAPFAACRTARELERVKAAHKRDMLFYILGKSNVRFCEDVLTIGWFRRFAEYKRPALILRHFDWLKRHLENGDFQLVMGGKPHPDDKAMIDCWNELYRLSQTLPNFAMLPGYDPEMSKIVKAGCDLWFSSPRVPFEASSTSPMSAGMLGTNLLSTRDGFLWDFTSADNLVFFFGTSVPTAMFEQDAFDAQDLCRVIDVDVLPEYVRKNAWYVRALRIKQRMEEQYNSDRMVAEYSTLYGLEPERV